VRLCFALAVTATTQYAARQLHVQTHPIQDRWRPLCAVVIPCLNESGTIGPLVHEVSNYLANVIVVNDGSTDSTASEAAAAGARVVQLPRSGGKGAALLAGWQAASKAGFSWVLNMDGDGQHAPADIPAFFAQTQVDRPELVIGNRLHNPQPMPRLRRFVNRWMTRQLSRRLGVKLEDSQCGFRLMPLSPFLSNLVTQRFEIESEIIAAAAGLNIPIRFVPIQVIYRSSGSKINPFTDTIRWFRWFFSIRPLTSRPLRDQHD
jgi:glycosyltransferase involved in cell wall biosynthesis